MGAIEPWHLVLLLVVILIVLGPGKLPQVGKGVGDALREFHKATSDLPESSRVDAPPFAAQAARTTQVSTLVAPPGAPDSSARQPG